MPFQFNRKIPSDTLVSILTPKLDALNQPGRALLPSQLLPGLQLQRNGNNVAEPVGMVLQTASQELLSIRQSVLLAMQGASRVKVKRGKKQFSFEVEGRVLRS